MPKLILFAITCCSVACEPRPAPPPLPPLSEEAMIWVRKCVEHNYMRKTDEFIANSKMDACFEAARKLYPPTEGTD